MKVKIHKLKVKGRPFKIYAGSDCMISIELVDKNGIVVNKCWWSTLHCSEVNGVTPKVTVMVRQLYSPSKRRVKETKILDEMS